MAIDPIKIPQNVHIEDRIVGPLTLRQIMIIGIGGGISYAVWASASKAYGGLGIVPTVIIWLPCVISLIFAFVKINDLSMMKICFLSIERAIKAPERTWSPRRGITVNIRTFSATPDATRRKEEVRAAVAAKGKGSGQLDAISSVLDHALQPGEAEPTLGEYGDTLVDRTANKSSGEPQAPAGIDVQQGESKFASIVPVRSNAVVAITPEETSNLDGISAPKAHSSIFRDISA